MRIWKKSRIITLGVVLSVCYWFVESIVDSYVFSTGTVMEQVFSPKPNELWMRGVITFLILAFSAYANSLVVKHRGLEEVCRESDKTRQALLNAAGDGAMLLSTDGTIDALNEKAAEALGTEPDQIIGKNVFDLLPPDISSRRRESGRIVTETGRPFQFEDERDGRWYHVTIYPVTDDESAVVQWAVFGREITETKKMEQELMRLSITDDLTGLYNQRHFIEKIDEEVERARRVGYSLCLVIFDVDDFKTYNDTYGHLKGNEILRAIGTITLRSIRKDVDSAYRFGGDEFALILPYSDRDTADEIIERIASRTKGRLGGVTISSGIATLTDGISTHDLIHLADQFMYRQKETGAGNRVPRGRQRTKRR
jgi:diguanylate cyclase (GGDEF)-like protein/PAS domain S-box-containing protein